MRELEAIKNDGESSFVKLKTLTNVEKGIDRHYSFLDSKIGSDALNEYLIDIARSLKQTLMERYD